MPCLDVDLFALTMVETWLAFSWWQPQFLLLPQSLLCPFFKQKQGPSVLGGKCASVLGERCPLILGGSDTLSPGGKCP